MALLIRAATESDLPILARMNKYLIEDEGSRNPKSVVELQHRMSEWLQGDWNVELLVDEETIVGYAVYQFRKDEYYPDKTAVYLRQFFIDRDKRNKGLGNLAFKTLAQTRFPTGCTIVIDALASNPRGYKFWSKLGFQPYCTTMHLQNQASIGQ